jgi:hypothetical protein
VDVGATGSGSSNPDPQAVGTLATALITTLSNSGSSPVPRSAHSGTKADIAAVSFEQLMAWPMQHLLRVVEDRLFNPEMKHAETMQSVKHAGLDGFYTHPSQSPSLSYGSLLRDARDSAEKSIAVAARTIDTAGAHGHRIPDSLDPLNVLALAEGFIQTGQLLNYVRAAELGRVVVSWYDGPLAISGGSAALVSIRDRKKASRVRIQEILKSIWHRAPLLCLLSGWLVAGLVASFFRWLLDVPADRTALAFNAWGLGFLVLVVFQFVVTIRAALRPK